VTDLYDIRGHGATWAAAESLYKAHPSKPFAFPEWGLWGFDDPAFVRDMAKWLRSHKRVEFAAYYSGRPGSIWDLASKPGSRSERGAARSSPSSAVGPGVVRALEADGRSARLLDDGRPAVLADVVERAELVVAAADDEERLAVELDPGLVLAHPEALAAGHDRGRDAHAALNHARRCATG